MQGAGPTVVAGDGWVSDVMVAHLYMLTSIATPEDLSQLTKPQLPTPLSGICTSLRLIASGIKGES